MPLYDFSCVNRKCLHRFESLLSHADLAESNHPVCPLCGSATARQLPLFGFSLADGGVGWARDNYSRRGSGSGNQKKED